MPTIDQLAPATAASDTDEFLASQNGITRKLTRAQILAGVQEQLAISSGSLLGRSSAGVGQPEQIIMGSNLALTAGVLSASSPPFNIASLSAGLVPANGDFVALGQGGQNVAITYSQFMSGLSGMGNVDVSQLLVTPTGAQSARKLADFAASTLPLTGGTLTGPLTLAADPTAVLQPATKQYVDAQLSTSLPKSGGTLTGPLTLQGDPTASLQPATKQYADAQVATALPITGGTLTGPLTLAADPTVALQPATKRYADTQVATALPKSGGTLTGMLTLSANPTMALQAAPKQYVDAQVGTAIPLAGGTLTGPLTLAADPAGTLQAATKQYVDQRVLRAGDTLTGPLVLAANPTTTLQAATKGYVDTQVTATANAAVPSAGGTMTGMLTLAANPTSNLHAATKQYVDTADTTNATAAAAAQTTANAALPKAGGTMTGTLTLSANPTTALQAAPKQYVDTQVGTAIPLAGGTLTGPLTLAADPAGSLQPATKQYVDQRVFRAGDTLTGPLVLAADPTTSLQAATKGYVDTQVTATANAAVPKAGGTMTGMLTLAADPASNLHAATKEYVDAADTTNAAASAAAQTTASAALPKAGGTMTGMLTLAADPASNMHATTKEYVDTSDTTNAAAAAAAQTIANAAVPKAGGTMTGALTISGGGPSGFTLSNTGSAGSGYSSLTIKTTASSAYGPGLVLDGSSITSGRKWLLLSSGTNDGNQLPTGKFSIFDLTSSVPRLVIDSAGNVTVGTPGSDGITGTQFVCSNILQTAFYNTPATTYTVSGTDLPTPFSVGVNYVGALTGSSLRAPFIVNTPTNSLDVSGASNGFWQEVFQQNFTGTKGGIGGVQIVMNQTANTADSSGSSFFINPLYTRLNLNYAPGAGSHGNGICNGSEVYLGASGTNWSLVETNEFAMSRAQGASVASSVITTSLFNATTSATTGIDAAMAFGAVAGSAVGLKQLIALGRSNDQWVMNPDGWLLQAIPQTNSNPGGTRRWAQACAGGWDFWNINFGTAAMRASGISIGSAAVKIGSANLAQGATGLSIDATGDIGAISGIAAAGASYQASDQLYDGLGGIILVDSVGAGGSITAAHYIPGKEPYSFGGPGPATVSTTGGSGNGAAQFSVSWTAKSTLSLQPSGGAIGFYGATPVAKQTGVAVTAAAIFTALSNLGLISA